MMLVPTFMIPGKVCTTLLDLGRLNLIVISEKKRIPAWTGKPSALF